MEVGVAVDDSTGLTFKEIRSSEESYVAILEKICTLFLQPAESVLSSVFALPSFLGGG